MPPTYKIALIQLAPEPLAPGSNFLRASQFIREAAAQGADLAVLPEYHLTGWVPDSPAFATLALDWKTWIRNYQSLARELKINIVPGTIVQADANANSDNDSSTASNGSSAPPLLNVATFISSTGEVLGTYTKLNLWHPERPHLSKPPAQIRSQSNPQQPHTLISTPLGPVGLLICWDLSFPESFRALIQQGAKIIIIPTYWTKGDGSEAGSRRNPDAEALFLDSVLTARAFENTCCVVMVNAGGKEGVGQDEEVEGGDFLGLSQVCMPFLGKVKGSFEGSGEGCRVVAVDMEILEEAERHYKIREDLGMEDWHYGYCHGDGRK